MFDKDTIFAVLSTAAYFIVNAAIIIGLYALGTWLFTFGRMFGTISVTILILALLIVAVKVWDSTGR